MGRVVEAGSVREGAAVGAIERADVAVVDLGLPDGDGVELVRRLRRAPGCPVLVLTMTRDEGVGARLPCRLPAPAGQPAQGLAAGRRGAGRPHRARRGVGTGAGGRARRAADRPSGPAARSTGPAESRGPAPARPPRTAGRTRASPPSWASRRRPCATGCRPCSACWVSRTGCRPPCWPGRRACRPAITLPDDGHACHARRDRGSSGEGVRHDERPGRCPDDQGRRVVARRNPRCGARPPAR